MTKSSISAAALLACGLLWIAPAMAAEFDEVRGAPYATEADVVAQLQHMGFVTWDEIEFDDGYWEIDDAVRYTGRTYDIKLDPRTLAVVHKDYEGMTSVRHGG